MHILSSLSAWINDWKVNESGIGPYHDMDTISMLLTGWVIFIFISVALVKYLYYRFVKKTGFGEFEDSDSKAIALASEEQEGASSLTKTVVETITGVKSLVTKSQPQAPTRRRKVDKSGSLLGESFDEIAAVNASGPCTGSDPEVVDFINQSYDWAFNYKGTQKRSWEDIRETFINSVNKTLRDEDLKNDLGISVVDFKLRDDVKLTNTFAECIHPNNIKITSDCELQVNGEATIASKESGLKRCQFFVDRLCGRLSTLLDTEEKTAIVKLDGWPEICVGISSIRNPLDQQLTEQVGDRITSAIRNCVAEIDYSHFDSFPVAQKFSPKKHLSQNDDRKKYLLVKVVRAKELGLQKGCQEPYCAIELDEPPQKFQTDHVHSTDPVWNENFVFNVLPIGGELLFEVFDRVGTRFLGCTIISVDEIGGEKTRNLQLKSRRMEVTEQISGSLEVQFTLLGEKEYLQRSKDLAGKLSLNGNIKTTRAVFTRSPDAKSSTFAENVIKELERKTLPNANKSTLIIHAVQREASPCNSTIRQIVKIEKLPDGSYNEVYDDTSSLSRKDKLKNDEVATGIEGQYGTERGRKKTRKGDIFTSLRRRLSKGRSQSAVSSTGSGGAGVENEAVVAGEKDDPFQRSISADRQSMLSARLGLGSARSSTSELSGISGFSTTTFVHENSTLVIECVENRVRKYYLIPPNLAESGKWKKKGKKLHIYNDHTFVAKHLPSGTMCEICAMRLPFSLGKQGYQCRDCKMRCHKECHIHAPSFCPKTTIYDIELSTAKRVEEKKPTTNVFTSLFGKKDNSVAATNKNVLSEANPIKSDSTKVKKKKSNIFRKVTKLGKISEENLTSRERLNGEAIGSQENEEKDDLTEESQTKENPTDKTVTEDNTKTDPSANKEASVTEVVQADVNAAEVTTHK